MKQTEKRTCNKAKVSILLVKKDFWKGKNSGFGEIGWEKRSGLGTKAPSRLNVSVVCRNPTDKQRGEHEGFGRGKFFSKAELSVQKIFKIQNTRDESDF